MFLHLNNLHETYSERRQRDEQDAAAWRLAREARRAASDGTTLSALLEEAGTVLTDAAAELADTTDPQRIVLIEALVTELAAAARRHGDEADLAPREGEPPIVALRTLAAISQRTAGRRIPVDGRRAAVVRGLLRQVRAADGSASRPDQAPAAASPRARFRRPAVRLAPTTVAANGCGRLPA